MNLSERKLTVLDQICSADGVRRRIIETASALYAKKGYAATSIEEIAETAGVSLPVTYHYVKRKSEIMRMIMEDLLSSFQESVAIQIESVHGPEEKLAAALVLYSKAVDQQKEKILLVYQKSGSLDADSKARIMQLEVEVSTIFGGIIQEGIVKGVFKEVDVDLTAFNIIMMAHMWVLKKWHFQRRFDLSRYIDSQLLSLFEGLRK
jgi:TetR/AcrR family transcriptional regulator, cholesterol catabolism regulator